MPFEARYRKGVDDDPSIGGATFHDWDIDLCSTCERFASDAGSLPDSKIKLDGMVKTLCVGLIKKSGDPKDLHDALNTIRLCLVRLDGEGIDCSDYTEFETLVVAECLIHAVTELSRRKQIQNAKKHHSL